MRIFVNLPNVFGRNFFSDGDCAIMWIIKYFSKVLLCFEMILHALIVCLKCSGNLEDYNSSLEYIILFTVYPYLF